MDTRYITLTAQPLLEIRLPKDDVLLYPKAVSRFVKNIIDQEFDAVNIDFDTWTIDFVNPSNDPRQYDIAFVQSLYDDEVIIRVTLLHFAYVVK